MTATLLLAFDTSSAAVTAAAHDGDAVVAEHTEIDPLRHGELLAPAISRVLRAADAGSGDLRAVAVGVGPGPFTGLRVGVVTARTLGAALGVPVYGVCSLDILAAEARVGEPFLVATDARRKEVYWARYDANGSRRGEPAVGRPAAIATDCPTAGRGAVLYPEHFPNAVPPEYLSAATLAALVAEGSVEPLPAVPLYLRRPDVSRPSAAKSVL
jgi:tRNA threonylcarbamoyladenosine biosynthesis protein TsaB